METLMTREEFELRYIAYLGMGRKFHLNRDEAMLLQLTKISDKGILEKTLTETSPEDLQNFTYQTYSSFKTEFIAQHQTVFPYEDKKFSLAAYAERLEYELKVIKEMGFNSYFLIVSDYVRRAKDHQISVGPGRGSGAGSVLARFVGITDVDPLPFDLLFERFLNPSRVSMPDFDIDFEDTLREKVVQYVTEKYGSDKVSSIGTFMKMASKAAFKDAARTLGIPFERSNYISNLLSDGLGLLETITSPEGNEELKTLYETDDKIKQAIDFGDELTGNMRQLGVHACGIIIAPQPVTQFTPTQFNKENDHTIVSQYDGPTLEYIGLLKMDFLGLRNLSIIKNCIKIIKLKNEKIGEPLPEIFQHFLDTMSFNPPLDDAYTYEKVFKEGDTTGIFQFESPGMRRFLIQLEPDTINNIVAMAALYRPGPMEFIPAYIERRHGREEIEYLYPDLRLTLTKKYGEAVAEEERTKLIEDLHLIMKDTYGIAVYQEQLMFLVQAMAGFSLGEADVLRRGIGKKKKEIIEKLKQEFIEKGAAFRGYKPETTKEIYERMIEPAAQYSFNKSHAVCYALIAYQTAYLKAHYPVEFYAALVRSVEEDTDTQSFYISEIQYHGIAVYPPDVNISFNHVAAIDDSVRIGFSSIKGVGVEVGETIQQERQKNGKFTSLEDFCKRCDSVLNKKSLDGIIKAGALDTFADRNVLWENSDIILNRIKNSANADQGLFGGMETNITLKKADSSTLMERLMMEQEVFKAFISGNPLDGLYRYIKKNTLFSQIKDKTDVPQFISICYIKDIQRARKKGFFIKVEDITETFEFFVADPCGLEKFDVLILHGLKRNNRVQITKVIKTSRKRLKELAGSSYDENDTVVNVKKARYGEQKQAELEQIKKGTDTEQQKMVVKEMVVKDVERDEDAESEEEIVEEIPSDIPACDCESVAETEIISEVEDTTSETEITAEAEKEPETAPDTNVLLEHAKEILNEIVDPTLPLVIDVSLLKTVENIRYVAELIKANPGERRATILGKDVQLSDYAVEVLKERFKL